MTSKYIIRRHEPVTNKWQFLYLYHTGQVVWHDVTPTSATRFDSKGQAVLCLESGQKGEPPWGGVHVVEEIFVL